MTGTLVPCGWIFFQAFKRFLLRSFRPGLYYAYVFSFVFSTVDYTCIFVFFSRYGCLFACRVIAGKVENLVAVLSLQPFNLSFFSLTTGIDYLANRWIFQDLQEKLDVQLGLRLWCQPITLLPEKIAVAFAAPHDWSLKHEVWMVVQCIERVRSVETLPRFRQIQT